MARIYALWDKMSVVDASDADHALCTLLKDLCRLVPSRTALAMSAVRMPNIARHRDPTRGWRPRHVLYLHSSAKARARASRAMHRHNQGARDPLNTDPTVVNNLAGAGTWRANRLCDLAPPEWFDSPMYQDLYITAGRRDAIWAACPVNADLELYIGLFRDHRQPLYEPHECDTVLLALRGLYWFAQHYLLSLGLDLARTPLTRTERSVLQRLLKGAAPKVIAAQMTQSIYTTHEHIQSIYRKFNVRSRAELSALWLA